MRIWHRPWHVSTFGNYWCVTMDPENPLNHRVFDDGSADGEYGQICGKGTRDFLLLAPRMATLLLSMVNNPGVGMHPHMRYEMEAICKELEKP